MHRHNRFKITKKDLKRFGVMCLIALVVGAGIVLVDENSRNMLDSFKDSTIAEIKHQIEHYKSKELEKIKQRQSKQPK